MGQNIAGCSLWKRVKTAGVVCWLLAAVSIGTAVGQTVNVTLQGRVYDSTGAAIPQASVTAVNAATALSRSATASVLGDYQIALLPPGDYTVTAERQGFQKSAKKIHLDIGAAGNAFDQCPRRPRGIDRDASSIFAYDTADRFCPGRERSVRQNASDPDLDG